MEVKKKMNVIFKDEEEYQKFKSGKTHSNKGLRTEDGKLSSLPDIEDIEIDEDYHYDVGPQQEMRAGQQIMYAILEGLYEGVKDFLSDEQNRQAIAALTRNWWNGKAVPGIRKGWNEVRGFIHDVKSGEIKASKVIKKEKTELIEADYVEVIDNTKFNDKGQKISREEYARQVDQIKMLAMLLADRIKKLSNSCVDPNKMSEEECRIQQQEIKELTTEDVLKSIKLLIAHENFSLDDSTIKMFSEFIAGNIIVEGEVIPIETVKDSLRRI